MIRDFWTFQKSHLKDIRRKNIDLYIFILPGIGRKACLLASVLQEGLTIPSIFCGHLGKEKARIPSFLNIDPMLSNLNFIHILNPFQGGQNRYLKLQFWKFFLFYRSKAWVLKRRCLSHFLNGLMK